MEEQKEARKMRRWIIPLFLVISLAILVSDIASGFVNGLVVGFFSALTPILAGLFIVFLLKHLIDFIEQKFLKNSFVNNKKQFAIKRTISITISFIVLFAVSFIIIKMIVPRIFEIVTELFSNREIYIYQIKTQLTDFVNSLIAISSDGTVDTIINSIVGYLEDAFNNFLPQILAISTTTLVFIGQLLLGVFLAFLYLKDKEKIRDLFKRLTLSKMKKEKAENCFAIIQKSDKVLLDYFNASMLAAIVITIGLGITLSILGVRFAFELALTISILNFIPYIGFIIGLVPTILITLIYGSVDLAITMLISVIIVFTILTTFVTPYIVGKKIKTNVLPMLIGMLIGGGMFGMIGMVFAPPLVAIISELTKDKMSKTELTETLAQAETLTESDLTEPITFLGIDEQGKEVMVTNEHNDNDSPITKQSYTQKTKKKSAPKKELTDSENN